MPKRQKKPPKAVQDVQIQEQQYHKALAAAQERLLARRITLIPLQIQDDWPLSPFQGDAVIPRSSAEIELNRLVQQPRLRLRLWAAHCLEQLRLSNATSICINRVRWNDLNRYIAATDQLIWPEHTRYALVNYSSEGFSIYLLDIPPNQSLVDGTRIELDYHRLVFNQDGEYSSAEWGGLWQPYVASLDGYQPYR